MLNIIENCSLKLRLEGGGVVEKKIIKRTSGVEKQPSGINIEWKMEKLTENSIVFQGYWNHFKKLMDFLELVPEYFKIKWKISQRTL